MTEKLATEIVEKIFRAVFQISPNMSLDEVKKKFAFDVDLPKKVYDYTTNEETWAASKCSKKYITLKNMEQIDKTKGWMQAKEDVHSLEEIVTLWDKINATTSERYYDSIDVAKSDTIYSCERIYNSMDSSSSKNLIFCNSCHSSDSLLASSRSTSSTYCIRCDDSQNCSNSYNVICSNKIVNCLFIQDSFDLYECMFCSHIASKKYCIANMQFEESEYYQIKKRIVSWIVEA